MMTATFQVVGGERGVWLSDLKFAGFEQNLDMMYDGQLTFNIQIRDTDGNIAKTLDSSLKNYTWTQLFDNEGWIEAGEDPATAADYMLGSAWTWDKGEVQAHVEGSDLWLPAGTGIWLDSPAKSENDPDAEYTITFNGEVNTADCPVVFKKGKNPTGNMFPLGIRLTSMIPTGFQQNTDMMYDGQITFNVQILDSTGNIDTTAEKVLRNYTYTQLFDNEGWIEAGEDPSTAADYMLGASWSWDKGTIVAESDDDPIFVPSEGLWIDAPGVSENDPTAEYSITFRCPPIK